MKITIKIVIITVIGLITAIVIYPFLHEIGHIITILGCGGKVIEYKLFPEIYILSDISSISKMKLSFIGMSGITFPLLISVFLYSKNFLFWYSAFVLRGIILLSLIISAVVIILDYFGIANKNDDVIKVLKYSNISRNEILSFIVPIIVIILIVLIKSHPIKRIMNELN